MITISEKKIFDKLVDNDIPVVRVHWMTREGRILLMVVVTLQKDNPKTENIFKVTNIGYSGMTMEKRHKPKCQSQCRGCMVYGLTFNYCRANWVCSHCTKCSLVRDCASLKSQRKTSAKCLTAVALTQPCPKNPNFRTNNSLNNQNSYGF